MDRRKFVKKFILSAAAYYAGRGHGSSVAKADSKNGLPVNSVNPNPLQLKSDAEKWSGSFNGDDIEKSHQILWNVDGFIQSMGGIPTATETAPVVVVGGGISGLVNTFYLQNHSPILLEQAENFGGNSRGEIVGGQYYSIGAAYINRPEPGTTLEELLKTLGILPYARGEKGDDTSVLFKNRLAKGFWQGSLHPESAQQFVKLHADLKLIREKYYPEIPYTGGKDTLPYQKLLELDRLSFKDWLSSLYPNLHPSIVEYFQLYAWSSFGGSIDELSAAQMLNFVTAETEEIIAFPGGNSFVAQALFQNLQAKIGLSRLRSSSMVVDVRVNGNATFVCYLGADNRLHTIQCDRCVIAAPKFVAKKIVKSMSQDQVNACDQIDYRAYLVGNVFVKGPFKSPCFDLFCLEGDVPPSPSALNPPNRLFSDVCFGSWAQGDGGEGILTVYKPLPFQGARQFLFQEGAHDKHRNLILQGAQSLLASLGLSPDRITGLRMTRWGHSLPLAGKGLLSSGHLAKASAPIENRIFFSNQDNWVNPSLETTVTLAKAMAGYLQ